MSRTARSMQTPSPWLRVPTLALGAILGGAAAALALLATPEALRGQRTLVLGGLLALPAPLIAMALLATPPALAVRRALGEPSATTLASLRAPLLHAVGCSLLAPVGAVLVALLVQAGVLDLGVADLAGDPGDARGRAIADLQRLAIGLGLSTTGAVALGTTTVAWALQSIGSGKTDRVAAMAGGGVYGPAFFAPLLYAPTFGYVGALLPLGVYSALWSALPEPLAWPQLLGPVAAILIAESALASRALVALGPMAHRAWLRVDEALATPFALDRNRPEPPAWLAGSAPLGLVLGRAWVRRRPLPAAGPVAATLLLAWALGAGAGPIAWLVLGGALGAAAVLRAAAQAADEPELAAAATLLGARSDALAAARDRLALGLAAPAGVAALILAWRGPLWPGPLGVGLGVAAAWLLVRTMAPARALALHRAALAAALLSALLGSAVG